MKTILLCLVSIIFVFWLILQGLSFWNDYQYLYIHEHHLRAQDTAFYAVICVDTKKAEETGSAIRCHDIKDRHALPIATIALKKAVDKYNVCDVQCMKDGIFNPTSLIVLSVLVAGAFFFRFLMFLQPRAPTAFPMVWKNPGNEVFAAAQRQLIEDERMLDRIPKKMV